MGKFNKVKMQDRDRGGINKFLEIIDEERNVVVEQIHGTLQIDGETHPPKSKVAKEIGKLHGRRRKRKITGDQQTSSTP